MLYIAICIRIFIVRVSRVAPKGFLASFLVGLFLRLGKDRGKRTLKHVFPGQGGRGCVCEEAKGGLFSQFSRLLGDWRQTPTKLEQIC